MSLNFWINLVFAFLLFLIALLVINHSKISFIRRLRAEYLRRRVVPKMQAILPTILNVFRSQQPDMFPLFRLKADLESLSSRSEVLYPVERKVLADFLARLSTGLSNFEAQLITSQEVDELILCGQRVVVEFSELADRK